MRESKHGGKRESERERGEMGVERKREGEENGSKVKKECKHWKEVMMREREKSIEIHRE